MHPRKMTRQQRRKEEREAMREQITQDFLDKDDPWMDRLLLADAFLGGLFIGLFIYILCLSVYSTFYELFLAF